ncbi:MAG: phage holin family protein, partial [Candidatus Binatia bacterium]
ILLAASFFIFAIGVIMLSLMAAFLLDRYSILPLWASFGCVGVVYVIVAGVLFAMGKRKVAEIDAFPRDSVNGAKEDVRYIKQAIRR